MGFDGNCRWLEQCNLFLMRVDFGGQCRWLERDTVSLVAYFSSGWDLVVFVSGLSGMWWSVFPLIFRPVFGHFGSLASAQLQPMAVFQQNPCLYITTE